MSNLIVALRRMFTKKPAQSAPPEELKAGLGDQRTSPREEFSWMPDPACLGATLSRTIPQEKQ